MTALFRYTSPQFHPTPVRINGKSRLFCSFRGQKAPTGSFSAKTLPVGPEYHAFGT